MTLLLFDIDLDTRIDYAENKLTKLYKYYIGEDRSKKQVLYSRIKRAEQKLIILRGLAEKSTKDKATAPRTTQFL